VHEVDVIRILTFSAVIAVHAVAFTQLPANQVAAGALMLLQFGRELFFALTGFVLVHSALRRYPGARSFWRRRFFYIGVPYLAWTLVYWLDSVVAGGIGGPHPTLTSDLLTGGASYHLYFLVVTMQLYLAFPLILRFVRRTADRAWAVLGVVGVLNLAWLAALQYVDQPAGWAAWFWQHGYLLLPTYSVYVLAGCYAAIHLPRLREIVHGRSATLVAVGTGAAVVALIAYAVQLPSRAPRTAADVLQPATLFTCVAAVLLLVAASSRWVERGMPRARLVTEASDISFGVYLAHPLVLQLLLHAGLGNGMQRVPSVVATVLAFAGAAAGAALITLAARRTPLSLALAGRPQLRRPAPQPVLREVPAGAEGRLRVLTVEEATIAS
jgi:peptidoglycan/LPS O-acetylase OafA/YrhL